MSAEQRRLVHNHGSTQYELFIGDTRIGYLDYELSGEMIVMHNTFVDEAHKGRGLGGVMVEAAMSDCRARGHRVVVQCPFVKAWLGQHPEYLELLA